MMANLQTQHSSLMQATEQNDFQNIVEICPFPIIIHKMGTVLFVNALGWEMFGFGNAEEMVGKNLLQLTLPEDKQKVIDAVARGAKEKTNNAVLVSRMLTADGRIINVETKSSTISFNGEECRVAIAYNYDYTTQVEKELESKTLLIEKITETIPNYLSLYNVQTHKIEYANFPMWTMLGYELNEEPASLMEYFHPDYRATATEGFAKLAILKEGEIFSRIGKYISKQGQTKFLLVRDTSFSFDENGNTQLVLSTVTDMSELKQAELKLEVSEETRKAILSALPDIVFQVDTAGVVRDFYANEVYSAALNKMNLIGRSGREILPVPDFEKLLIAINTAIESGRMQTHDYVHFEKGVSLHYEFRVSRLNETQGIVVARDITNLMTTREKLDQKIGELWQKNIQLEKYITSNTELEKFAYIASHDLREPIRSIVGFTQLLQRRANDNTDPEIKEFLGNIIDSAQRMNTLVHGLLDYSRVSSAGKNFHLINTSSLLEKVTNDLKATIEECDAKIVLQNLPEIKCDELQMRQLFQNLISNGIKFRKKDEKPRIEISAEQQLDKIVFRIQDNGIGLDMKYAEKVFQFFSRLHTADKYQGSGIGLAVCKKIVERHDGEIWLESELGKGTSIYFSIACEQL